MTATPTPPLPAKFPGVCNRCRRPIAIGDLIFYVRGHGARHAAGCDPAPIPAPTGDLRRVIEYLHAQGEKNRLTSFEESLARQYVLKGTLSEKQIACVIRRLDDSPEDLPDAETVPAGRYALEHDGDEYYVRVWRGRDKSIVRCYLLHGPETETEVSRKDTLEAIVKAGVGEAAIRYGRATGHCSQCSLPLSNRLSRWLGIGPVCGDRVHDHMTWLARKADGRADLRAQGLDPNETLIESEVM